MPRRKTEAPESEAPKIDAGPSPEVLAMNDLARRIYAGQSVSLPEKERRRRIEVALVAQGYGATLAQLEL